MHKTCIRNPSELKLAAGGSPADVHSATVLQCCGQIFSSEGQTGPVAFALSGRDVHMSVHEEKVRIPLGKSNYNTTSVTQRRPKNFLGKKPGGVFSSVIMAEILPSGNCFLHHSIYVVFPEFVH